MSSKYRKQRRQPPTSAEVLFAIQSSLDDYMDTGSFALIPVLEQVCVALAEITERIRNVQGDEEIRGRIATSLRRLLDGVKSLSDLAGDKVQQSNRTLQLDKKIATNQQLRTTVQTLIIRLKAIDLQAGKESTLQGVSAGLTEAADGFETCSRADLEKVVEDALMGQDTEWARSHSRLSSYEKQLLQVNYDHAEWLFQHPNFKSWLHESPVLGIYGNVATGKTYLASAVVKKMLRDGDLITFCFGDMFNNETRNVSGAMRVLFSRVPGMFTGGPGFNGSADHHDRDIMTIEGALGGKDTFDVQQIVDIFSGLLHSNSLIVVVDAVDECGSGDKLLDILLGLVERARVGSQGSVKLLVTSRSGNDIIRKKMAQYLHICLDEEDRVDRATLQRQIDNALQQWPVMRDLPAELRKPLVETLTNCDHGSYRWIRRQPKAMEALKADPVKAIFNSNYTVRWMKRLSKKDAECFIEALYYWTSEMDSLPALYSNVLLRVLRKICKSYDILPQGIYLKSQDIALSEKAEYAVASGNSVVSTGRYRDKLVACKRVTGWSELTMSNVCREVIVWKHLRHTNIVPLLGVSDIDGARYMISEWMTNGSVRDYANEQEASNKRRWELILDTVAGMEYLHSKEVIHGDLKSSNVLVNNGGRACITDFGLNAVKYNIRSINVATDIPGTGYYGTIQWMPPEYFDPDTAGITHPVQEGDIYSLAGVIWEIFTGEQPFFGVRNATVLSLRLLGEHPQRPSEHSAHGMSDRAWEILTRCWSTDRANRPAAYDLLADLRAEFQAQAPL